MKKHWLAAGVIGAVLLSGTAAQAHHVMDGTLPQTFLGGLLSGIGHPIIGLDHFAFLIAVGLVAALYRNAYALPAYFLVTMIAGVGIHLGALDIPAAEVAIAVSVIVLGGLAIRARSIPVALAAALFALSGLVHGYAYGESIIGAETSPLIAYFIGLVIVQYAVAAGVARFVRGDVAARWQAEPARIAGGAVLGVGLVFLVNNVAA